MLYKQHFKKYLINKLSKNRILSNINVVTKYYAEKIDKQFKESSAAIQISNDTPIVTDSKFINSVTRRLSIYWQWYKHLTGLHTVEMAKQDVMSIQNKLFACQEERRYYSQQITSLNDQIRDIYSEMLIIKRNDPKYVQLTIKENKSLQENSKIMEKLSVLENQEKDYFAQLATANKEYQDIEAINAQKYKYLCIIVSVLIALFSCFSTYMYDRRRTMYIHNLIIDTQVKNEAALKNYFDSLQSNLEQKLSIFTSQNVKKHLEDIANSDATVKNNDENISNPVTTMKTNFKDHISKQDYIYVKIGAIFLIVALILKEFY